MIRKTILALSVATLATGAATLPGEQTDQPLGARAKQLRDVKAARGAAIVGEHAGELIQPWVLAMSQGIKVSALAGMIAPYPTLGEASKRAASSFYMPMLFSARTKWLVRLLARLG